MYETEFQEYQLNSSINPEKNSCGVHRLATPLPFPAWALPRLGDRGRLEGKEEKLINTPGVWGKRPPADVEKFLSSGHSSCTARPASVLFPTSLFHEGIAEALWRYTWDQTIRRWLRRNGPVNLLCPLPPFLLVKDFVFCELRGDHMQVFFHCAEGEAASPASTLTVALLFTAGWQPGEWAEDDSLLARTSRKLEKH